MSTSAELPRIAPLSEIRLRTWVFGAPHFEELCKVRDSLHSPQFSGLTPSALERATEYLNEVLAGITNKAVGALAAAAFFGGTSAQIYLAENAPQGRLVTFAGIAAFFIFSCAAMLFASCLWVAWWKDSRHFFEAHANFDSTLLLSVGRAKRYTHGLILLFIGIIMLLLSIAEVSYRKMQLMDRLPQSHTDGISAPSSGSKTP